MAIPENNIFVLDDGTVEYTITNQFKQEICKLHIRPSDLSIVDRYDKFTTDFDEIVEPLKEVNLKKDGTPETDSSFDKSWQIMKSIEKEIINRINGIFDMQDADKLFANRNAFSSVNGTFYVEKVIDMLGKIVTSALESEGKKTEARIKKYTNDLKKEKK